jgi:ATP synthase protein I
MADNDRLAELQQKITALRNKSRKGKYTKHQQHNQGVTLISDMIGGIVVGCLLGYELDEWLHTKPLFFFILVILGMAGGFYNFYKHELTGNKYNKDE